MIIDPELRKEFNRRLNGWRDGHRDPAMSDNLCTRSGLEAARRFAQSELRLVDEMLNGRHQHLTDDDMRDARYWRHALCTEISDLDERMARLE